jgi:hypothetical protein
MDVASWSVKERWVSAIYLLGSLALFASMYVEKVELTLSDLFQGLGLFALIIGGVLNPKIFMQPIKFNLKAPVQAPSLIICFAFFCALQLLSMAIKLVMQ